MNSKSPWPLIVAIAIIAIACFVQYAPTDDSRPEPEPTGLNLERVFATHDDRDQAETDAHIIATILAAMAEIVEYDGTRTPPRLKTGVHFEDLRLAIRELRMKGRSFATRYPELGPTFDAYLTTAVGTDGGPVSPEKRQRWVHSLRSLSIACDHAARVR